MDDSLIIDKARLLEQIRATEQFGTIKFVFCNDDEFEKLTQLMSDMDIILALTERKVNIAFTPAKDVVDHKFMHRVHIYAIYTAALELASRSEFSTEKWIELLVNHAVTTLSEVENVEDFLSPIEKFWPDSLPKDDELAELRNKQSSDQKSEDRKSREAKIDPLVRERTDEIWEELTNAKDQYISLPPVAVMMIMPLLIIGLETEKGKEIDSPELRSVIRSMDQFVRSVSPGLKGLAKEVKNL